MNMRFAVATDLEYLVVIAGSIFDGHQKPAMFNWPEASLREEFRQVTTLVFENERGEISGFLGYRQMPDFFEISILATAPAAQRTGVQTRLLLYLQDIAAKQRMDIFLEVHQDNLSAFALYRKLGFSLVHTRTNYYKDGAGALVLKWSILLQINKAGC